MSSSRQARMTRHAISPRFAFWFLWFWGAATRRYHHGSGAFGSPGGARHARTYYSKEAMESAPAGKVTYVSLSADDPVMNASLDEAIEMVRGQLSRTWPLHIGGLFQQGGPVAAALLTGNTVVMK